MNFAQRAAVGFLGFALVIGVVSAVLRGASVQAGLAAGAIGYVITAAGLLFIWWVVGGVDALRQLYPKQKKEEPTEYDSPKQLPVL